LLNVSPAIDGAAIVAAVNATAQIHKVFATAFM
jgi:hypothetical protein